MRLILASVIVGAALLQGCAYYPMPMAVPAMVQAAPSSYRVLFNWDSANLTDQGRQIVREAAAASGNSRIEVDGHTDTSGPQRYNLVLSMRRARAVATELVRNGVPLAAINIQGYGETQPLVPTGDGVREPLNRRVEIILQPSAVAQMPPVPVPVPTYVPVPVPTYVPVPIYVPVPTYVPVPVLVPRMPPPYPGRYYGDPRFFAGRGYWGGYR